jgi:hypothetical protein
VRIASSANVENAVDDEREGAGEREEPAAERRGGEADRGLPAGHDGHGRGQLALRHDGPKRTRLRRREDRGAAPLDERDERDRPEDDLVEEDQRAEASDGKSAAGVR